MSSSSFEASTMQSFDSLKNKFTYILGARQCGKRTLLRNIAKDYKKVTVFTPLDWLYPAGWETREFKQIKEFEPEKGQLMIVNDVIFEPKMWQ